MPDSTLLRDPHPTPSVGDSAAPPAPVPRPTDRYQIGDEIARGGMGAVHRATDTALGREVAVKVLLPGTGAGAARRFADEARIAGQLQHPAIPPVHDLGTLPDGRPFLAMKLIKGDTLDRLLKARPDPAADHGRFVAAFEKVCEGVAYAHAHGVVHRDLKPQNVMVGLYGEVQVMDWGLAKVLGAGGGAGPADDPDATAPGTEVRSGRDADDPLTQAGAVLGTPPYMPPEQAIGAVDQIDRRSDVFGLGGILAMILTGEPPFVGTTKESTRQLAAKGRVEDCFARLDGCGADPGLMALCKRCLAPEKADRPADAGAVADEVAKLRAAADDRARRAEVERGRSEVRRRLTLRLGGLAAAVLLTGVAATGWQWWRAATQKAATSAALADKSAEFDRAEAALRERDAERGRTVAALRKLTDDVVEANLARKPELTDDDRRFLREVLGLWQAVADTRGDGPANDELRADGAFRVGRVRQRLGEAADAEAAYRVALDLYDRLAADFPARSDYHDRLATTHAKLGVLLRYDGRVTEAEAAYRAALSGYERLAADFPARLEHRHHLAGTYVNLGILLAAGGRAAEAEVAYRAALGTQDKLVAASPARPDYCSDLALIHANLGSLLLDAGRVTEAEAAYRVALLTWDRLVAGPPARPRYRRDAAGARGNLAYLLSKTGRSPEAEAMYRSALTIQDKLAADFPVLSDYRSDLALSHTNLGNLLLMSGRAAEAEAAYRAALALREKLVADFPARPDHQTDLGGSCCNLGSLLSNTGKPADSLGWYAKAIAALAPIHAADIQQVTPRQFLRNSYGGRAVALDRLGRHAEAVADWDRAVDLSLLAEQPPRRAFRANSLVQAGQVGRAVAEVTELSALPWKWHAVQWYDFACVYAVASGKVPDKREEYAGRAVELLRKAVAAGYRDRAHIAKDTDLDSLRGRADFRELLNSLPELAPKPRPVR